MTKPWLKYQDGPWTKYQKESQTVGGAVGDDKQGTGAMPFANRAIASTVGAPVDAITWGLNLIPGVEIV